MKETDNFVPSNLSLFVDKLKDDKAFGRSKIQYELFVYLYERTAQNEIITEYDIGFDVLQKGDGFDPLVDASVRANVSRLRKNIELYNVKIARDRGFFISFPSGGYKLYLKKGKQKNSKKTRVNFHFSVFVSIILLTIFLVVMGSFFKNSNSSKITGNQTQCSNKVPNVNLEIVSFDSPDFKTIEHTIKFVFSQYTHASLVEILTPCNSGPPDYKLTVSLTIKEFQTNINLNLTYSATKETIFSDLIVLKNEKDDDGIFILVRTLGDLIKPYGLIPRHAGGIDWQDMNARQNTVCQLQMYDSFISDAPNAYYDALECLNVLADSGNASADSLAALGKHMIFQTVGGLEKTVPDPFQTGKDYILEARYMSEPSSMAAQFELYMEAKNPDFSAQRMEEVIYRLQRNYPNNSLIQLDLSYHIGHYLGRWEDALELALHVRNIHSERDNFVYAADTGYHLLHSSPQEAIEWCEKFYSEASTIHNVFMNSCAYLAKDQNWINKTEAFLNEKGLIDVQSRITLIQNFKWHKSIESRYIEGLEMREKSSK